MAGVILEGDWVRLARTLRRMQLSQMDLKKLNEQIGAVVRESTRARFDAEKAPDGEDWQPLSPATIEARARRRTRGKFRTKRGKVSKRAQTIMGSARILKDTGGLRASISSKAMPTGVAVGTNKIQAAIQQLGGKAGRGKQVKIPARPYLGVSDDDAADIHQLLVDFAEGRVVE